MGGRRFTLPRCFFSVQATSGIFNSYLFSELLLAQLVQREELSCQGDVLQESAAGQLHSDDDLTIGDHHGHVPELDLRNTT